jgi:hypothetical protein
MADAPDQGAAGEAPPLESPLTVETEGGAFADHPEILVGGAFIGGLALALLVRRVSE